MLFQDKTLKLLCVIRQQPTQHTEVQITLYRSVHDAHAHADSVVFVPQATHWVPKKPATFGGT